MNSFMLNQRLIPVCFIVLVIVVISDEYNVNSPIYKAVQNLVKRGASGRKSKTKVVTPFCVSKALKKCGMDLELEAPNGRPNIAFNKSVSKCIIAQSKACTVDYEDYGETIIQHRAAPFQLNFLRNYSEYKYGFRHRGEKFLGLKKIHELTKKGSWALRVDLTHQDGTTAWFKYKRFRLTNEKDGYRLKVSGPVKGTLKYDVLRCAGSNSSKENAPQFNYLAQNGKKFSAPDLDNDESPMHCARHLRGGFWYSSCYLINLNGWPGYSFDYVAGSCGKVRTTKFLKVSTMLIWKNLKI